MIKPNQNYSLINSLFNKKNDIEDFFISQFNKTKPPFYCSVDLRFSGYKLSAIDTNLFPAGFNNLAKNSLQFVSQKFKEQINTLCPHSKKILILAESNTRNLAYLENIFTLNLICKNAGFDVRIGSFLPETQVLKTSFGNEVILHSLMKENEYLYTDENFCPCAILLNNDLSSGVPELLQNIKQLIIPSEQMGWQKRLKSVHFHHYQNVCELFSKSVGIDSWFFNPLFRKCGKIDFMTKSGEDCLAENVANLLGLIQEKYTQYEIAEKPFVVIKDDAGTYGMGIITVSSADEVYNLNRKQRKKMNYGKSKNSISKVILQEGVQSIENISITGTRATAEPVIYLSAGVMVGSFYRAHKEKDGLSVLNTPGMEFVSLDIFDLKNNSKTNDQLDEKLLYAYNTIARLASLAAAFEIYEINKN